MIDPTPFYGLIMFVALVGLTLIGVHIGIAMGGLGLLFAFLFYGGIQAVDLAGLTTWSHAASYNMTMIPMFVLMGAICSECGIGEYAYLAFYKWLKNIKGSIAMASTAACALFASITGSSAATVAAIGGISVPQMKKLGYDRRLALGSVAAAGTLGILIPPSIPMIIYATLTDVSVGKLFIAGIIPGVITALLYAGLIYSRVRLDPKLAPVGPEIYTLKEKISSLVMPLPIFAIFITIMASIYLGIASPTEAGGLGVIATLIVVLAIRKLKWRGFKAGVRESLFITAFIMLLIFGAMLFAHTIALTGFPNMLLTLVTSYGINPYLTATLVVIISILLGCVLDVWGLMVLTVPIFFPVMVNVGWNPVWYGILTVMLIEQALITPPVAANLYIAQALDPDATTGDVTRGILPFFGIEFVAIGLLIAFPQIALWLPSTMVR